MIKEYIDQKLTLSMIEVMVVISIIVMVGAMAFHAWNTQNKPIPTANITIECFQNGAKYVEFHTNQVETVCVNKGHDGEVCDVNVIMFTPKDTNKQVSLNTQNCIITK